MKTIGQIVGMERKDINTGYGHHQGWNTAIGTEVEVDLNEMQQAASRGYCTKRNEKKQLDAHLLLDVCEAIAQAILEGRILKTKGE